MTTTPHQPPMTEEQLREIEELTNQASPEPWTVEEGEPVEGSPFRHINGWTDTGEGEWLCLSPEDAAFVAAARSAVPLLLGEITRLRAELEAEKWRSRRFYRQFVDALKHPEHYGPIRLGGPGISESRKALEILARTAWEEVEAVEALKALGTHKPPTTATGEEQ